METNQKHKITTMEEYLITRKAVAEKMPWLNSDELLIATTYVMALQTEQARYNLNKSLAKSGIAPVPPDQKLNDKLAALGFPPINPMLFERFKFTLNQ